MFCNGMVVLPDGRAFINGGTLAYDPFQGSLMSSIFDPATNTFTDAPNMAHGRWYPTVLTLGDGRIMTFSGFLETGENTNTTVEFYTVGSGWSQPFTAPFTPDLYPRLHLLPNGKVFYSGAPPVSNLFDPSNNSWTQNVATTNYGGTREYGSSVLLGLTPANNYDPVVLILGRQPGDQHDRNDRPRRRHSEVDLRAEHVAASDRDERRAAAQRPGCGAWWFNQRRGSQHREFERGPL
jgi:hypothetical protein